MSEPGLFRKLPNQFIRKICLFPIILFSLSLSSCETVKHLLYTFDPLNFHTVKEGILYRSAQPSGRDLQRVVEKYNIKSVINLRGAHPGESWYDIEKKASEKLGLERIDIGMSASRLPHRDDLIRLLNAYKELPRPILIHCKAGADRTGEAAAMFALDHLGWSKRESAGQLSPFYGHFPDFQPSKTYFMRHVYQGESWARDAYHPCRENYKYYNKEGHCGVASSLRPFAVEFDDER